MFSQVRSKEDLVELLAERVRERLSRVLRSRFGCDMERLDSDTAMTYPLATKESAIRQGFADVDGGLLVPLTSTTGVEGWILVTGSVPDDLLLRRKICDLIDLTSVEISRITSRAESLVALESHLQQSLLPKNVVNLSEAKFSRVERRWASPRSDRAVVSRPTPQRKVFSPSCLIEGLNPIDVFKMALEIHALSQRANFVHWRDLTVADPSDLETLNSATVYIPLIEYLDAASADILLEFVRQAEADYDVRVVAGTAKDVAQLERENPNVARLFKALSNCRVRMQRPFQEYRALGLFEYLQGALFQESEGAPLL